MSVKNDFQSIFIKCFVLFSLVSATRCYRILGIFPHAGKSHFDVFHPMFLELAKRGHNVTVISHFPQQKTARNYYDISLAGTSPTLLNVIPFGMIGGDKLARIKHVFELAEFTNYVCETGFQSKELQTFMQKKEKYNIVLTEFFTTNCFVGLMHYTGGSLIGLTSSGIVPWVNDFVGNPDNPAYIPSIFIGHSDKMNFMERAQNVLFYVVHKVVYKFWIDLPANRRAKKYIDPNLPSLNKFVYNASLVLANIHHAVHRPRPNVPTIVEVGGMHIGGIKKLPLVCGVCFVCKISIDSESYVAKCI